MCFLILAGQRGLNDYWQELKDRNVPSRVHPIEWATIVPGLALNTLYNAGFLFGD
jgi:hypothetical protein